MMLPGIEQHDKIYVVSANDTESIKRLKNKKVYVVTYGLCSKATLTASSIEQNHMVLCLQRAIVTLDGKKIEPQEFSVYPSKEYDPETVMLIMAICLTSGVSADKLSKFMF
jgi:hypothetical protein